MACCPSKNIFRSKLERRLLRVVSNDHNLVNFPHSCSYQRKHVRRYNLAIKITPKAVTYPQTAVQTAAIIKCASDFNLKV